MVLLTAPVVQNSHILAGIYFFFQKNVLDQSLSIPKLDLSEKMGIVVINKTIFSTFSQLSCSNFKFKLFEKPFSHQNCLKD